MAKQMRTVDGAKYSPWQLLEAANGYYELSVVFTAGLHERLPPAGTPAPRQELAAASATNRVLALELYMKAFLVGAEAKVPLVHDLVVLYDSLPTLVRETVEKDYQRLCEEVDADASWDIYMSFQLSQHLTDVLPKPVGNPLGTELRGLLERNREAFVDSRYLFQKARHDEISYFRYEYRRLALLCRALCEILESALRNRSPDYRRGFTF